MPIKDLGVRTREPISPSVRQLLASQQGLITADQAALLGLGHHALRRMVDEGHWYRPVIGLYDASPYHESFAKLTWAAVLAAGRDAAIGGNAALRLAGIDRRQHLVEVWVPPDSQPVKYPGTVVRRDFLGRTERAVGEPARIQAAEAIADVGQHLRTSELVALLTDAARVRVATPIEVADVLNDRRRVHDRRRFVELLGDLSGIESTLEYAYRRDVERAHGLPIARRQVAVSAGTRSDVAYEDFGVLIELDGRAAHLSGAAVFRDRRRDNGHTASGWWTLRYGSEDVRGEPCEVANEVSEVLQSRGWRGSITPCERCRARRWA